MTMQKESNKQDGKKPLNGMPREQILNQVLMQIVMELLTIMRENDLNPVGEFMVRWMKPFIGEEYEQVEDDYKFIIHAATKYSDKLKQMERELYST